mgnify:CR=1 FL=1
MNKILLLVLVVIVFYMGFSYGQKNMDDKYHAQLDELEIEIQEARDRCDLYYDEILRLGWENDQLRYQLEVLGERMEAWLDEWQVEEKEITGYAPLDPRAEEGMCYAGDPNITASGQPVIIGQTVAAGSDVPFGTRIWIEDIGFRVVQDRGGRIGNGHIDVAVATQEEAFHGVGREKKLVVMQRY